MDLRLKRGAFFWLSVSLVLFLGIAFNLSRLRSSDLVEDKAIAVSKPRIDRVIDEQTQKRTNESIAMFNLATKSDKVDDLEQVVLSYRANLSNAFFSPQEFFKGIAISDRFIHELFAGLESQEGLDGIEFLAESDGPIPKLIERRMAILDFLRASAQEREDQRPLLMAKLRELSTTPIPAQVPDKVKRILVAERIDLILTMTLLDKEAALETMLSISEPLRTKLRVGYYLGLESSTESTEEYQEWVDKLIKED